MKFAQRRLKTEPSKLGLAEIDAPLLIAFLDHLEKERGNGARSRNARLAAIHSFFRYVALQEPEHAAQAQRVLAIPCKRYTRRPIDYLTSAEVEALLQAPDQKTWGGRRDAALLLVAVETGLRLSELIGLRCEDVVLGHGAHVRCEGKGRKERCTPTPFKVFSCGTDNVAIIGVPSPPGRKDDLMDEILQKFINKAPIAVMVQATAARAIGGSVLDEIFERHANDQYTRDLTFSTLTGLMTQVVFCTYPSVHAAYRENPEIPVSITSVYNKLNGLETAVSQAVVAETAVSMAEILASLPADSAAEPVAGLRLRILDGNALAGTDHRITCLRGCGAAALPGRSLVVRDSRTGLLTHIVPCEDAYTSERSLYADILPLVEPHDLWLADRNFCTADYLSGIQSRDAFFLIRHHAGSKLHPLGRECAAAVAGTQPSASNRCALVAWSAGVSSSA